MPDWAKNSRAAASGEVWVARERMTAASFWGLTARTWRFWLAVRQPSGNRIWKRRSGWRKRLSRKKPSRGFSPKVMPWRRRR
jgi:hypothetical protein